MRKEMIRQGLLVAATIAAGSAAAHAAELFTTNADFTPWTYDGPSSSVSTTGDTDGATLNGIGNTAAPGGTSSAGALTIAYSGGYRQAKSQEESANAAFLSALGSSGTLAIDFSVPTTYTPDYLQIEFVFNDSAGFQELGLVQFIGGPGGSSNGTVTNHGNGNYTLNENYTLNQPVGGYTYFQLETVFNSNATSGPNFTIDNIRTVAAPEPASISALLLPLTLIRRRRRS